MLVLGGVLLPVASLAGVREEMAKRNVLMRVAEAEVMLRPRQTNFYEFDQPTNDWKFLNQTLHDYAIGAVLSAETSFNPVFPEKTKISYSYNEDGSTKEKTERFAADGVNYTNVSKTVYEYDDVTGSRLSSINHSWNEENQKWEVAPGAIRETVTRNDKGHVVKIENESFTGGKWNPTIRYEFVYVDGKTGANDMLVYNYDESTQNWVSQNSGFYNIVWEETDCQYLAVFSDYTSGKNRIKSAEQGDEKNGLILIENSYSEKGYVTTQSYKETGAKISCLTFTKEDNGNTSSITEYFDGEGKVASIFSAQSIYDDKGNISTYTELTGASLETATIFSKWKYEYKFDNDGNMTEMASYRLDTTTDKPDVYIPVEKEEYLNYFNAASAVEEVENIAAPSFTVSKEAVAVAAQGNICVKVFNLSGACVAAAQADGQVEVSTVALPAGVYVVDIVSENGHVAHKFVK